MKKELINIIEQRMLGILNNEQFAKLHEVLVCSLTMFAENCEETQYSNDELLKLFLSAKQVEGCSERSLKYYRTTLSKMNEKINKSVRQVETNDIRTYISNYENESNAGKVTLDNIRRIISSFFAWLEDENYIIKSPARRIHRIRVGKTVKEAPAVRGGVSEKGEHIFCTGGILPPGIQLKIRVEIHVVCAAF